MSEYFRALKQIERDQIADRQPPAGPPAPPSPAAAQDAARPRNSVTVSDAPSVRRLRPLGVASSGDNHGKPESQRLVLPGDSRPPPDMPLPAYGALFDNLRVLGNEHAIRVLVLAGASTGDPTPAVTAGIAAHAAHLGLRVFTTALAEVNGRALLRPRPAFDSSLPDSAGNPVSLDLSRPGWEAAFTDWLRTAAAEADLVIIEGRPLGQSIDAAQLARACDGLVIVAQPEVTPRQALQAAAERARTVGCRTLGVVMHGTRNHIPNWLRSLTGDGARGLITPKVL